MSESSEAELNQASHELQRFLADQVPPLVVADSISLLIKHHPEITAKLIHSWAVSQNRFTRDVPFSDYLYHGIAKVNLMKEYNLIAAEEILPFLSRLKRLIVQFCPPEDRDRLSASLEHIDQIQISDPSSVESVIRPRTENRSRPAPEQNQTQSDSGSRLGFILRRLERQLSTAEPNYSPQTLERRDMLIADGLAEAVRTVKASDELVSVLDRLRHLGIDSNPDNLFRILGRRLPGWSLPEEAGSQLRPNKNLQAMQRIITTAESMQEAGARFRQLIVSAVERFNEGSLQQATSMIDLAEKIIVAKAVEPSVVEMVRGTANQTVDEEMLRKFAEIPDQHETFRRFLRFFTTLSPSGILETLRAESKRDRRRLLLLLLEVHDQNTRSIALERLQIPPENDRSQEDSYLRRNLLYLLRKISPSADEPVDKVATIIAAHLNLDLPDFLIKEALAYFPQIKHESVEQILLQLLQKIESFLLNPKGSPYESRELFPVLDRVTASLCRVGTATARKAVIEHSLKKKTEFGASMSRITELGNSDLSEDLQTVNLLLGAIQSALPLKMFGVVLQQRDWTVKNLVGALAGTPLPQVRTVLEQLAREYPNRESGKAAAKALSSRGQPAVAKRTAADSASLMGDMELFGLPSLLQNLSNAALSGTLTLRNSKSEAFATLVLDRGMIRYCRYGSLQSETAFYQIIEKPQPGTFHFSKGLDNGPADGEPREILGLLLEAIRRYDEVQDASVLIPDDQPLKVIQQRPVPLTEEKDGLFFRNLWAEIIKGTTPKDCDEILQVDSYRVRRLLLHWVQSGVLEPTTT